MTNRSVTTTVALGLVALLGGCRSSGISQADQTSFQRMRASEQTHVTYVSGANGETEDQKRAREQRERELMTMDTDGRYRPTNEVNAYQFGAPRNDPSYTRSGEYLGGVQK